MIKTYYDVGRMEINKNSLKIRLKPIYILVLTLYGYILLTNFSNPIVNTVFLSIFFVYAIAGKVENTISLVAFFIVYFGYSYLAFDNYLNLTAGQFVSIYTFLIVLRNVRFLIDLLINQKRNFIRLIFLLVLPFLLLVQKEYMGAARCLSAELFALLCAGVFRKNRKVIKFFTKVLIFALFSTYIYNLIYIQILNLDVAIEHLTYGRYVGVRDANNFALESNVAILFLEVSGLCSKKNTKNTILVLLSVGVLLTISMSGLASLCLVHWIRITKCSQNPNQKNKAVTTILLGFPTLVLILMILSALGSVAEIGLLGRVLSRVNTIMEQILAGEYSAATSSRTYLWMHYLNRWQSFSISEQWFGSYKTYAAMIKSQLGSHNTYIDMLMSYGYLGCTSLLIALFIGDRKRGEEALRGVRLLYLINIFFRSVDPLGATVFMYILL